MGQPAIRGLDWELRPGALKPFDGDEPLQYPSSDLQKTDEGDRTGLWLSCFLRSKRKEEKKRSIGTELALIDGPRT